MFGKTNNIRLPEPADAAETDVADALALSPLA